MSTGIGAATGALIGSEVAGDGRRAEGAMIGGVLGGMAGYLLSQHYQASQQQIRAAEYAASRSLRSSSVKNSGQRYVAVTVPKKSGRGKDLMIYDSKDKKLASDKVYVPPTGKKYNAGDTVYAGGRKAVVATAFQGL